MPKYKLVIFDMDGTILDTLKDLQTCLNVVLRAHGYEEKTIEQVKSYVGDGLKELVMRALPSRDDKNAPLLCAEFMAYYKEHLSDYTTAYNGVAELMANLKKRGIKVAIASNKPDIAVQDLAQRFFAGLYDIAVGETKERAKKPAPDEVEYVLKALGLEKSEAVYVGDSHVDYMTAKNSGTDCILVDWGFKPREFLSALGAKTIISTPKEIEDICTL